MLEVKLLFTGRSRCKLRSEINVYKKKIKKDMLFAATLCGVNAAVEEDRLCASVPYLYPL